jgi:hypothetical protein
MKEKSIFSLEILPLILAKFVLQKPLKKKSSPKITKSVPQNRNFIVFLFTSRFDPEKFGIEKFS